jgi:hypothetical protein
MLSQKIAVLLPYSAPPEEQKELAELWKATIVLWQQSQ